MRKIKSFLRDWLEISEDKLYLDAELIKMRNKIDSLEGQLGDAEYHIEELKRATGDLEYTLEDKVSTWDIEEYVEDAISYDTITDSVFDLVMQEIENRDTLQELVENKLEALTDEGRNNTGVYPDITEIVEDVVEELINKLRA